MSTGTGGENDVNPKIAKSKRKHSCESEFLSIRKKERVLNKGRRGCRSGLRGRTSQLLSTISLDPKGNGKNPWGIRVYLESVRMSREKGEILWRQVYGNILHVTDVESPINAELDPNSSSG